MLHDIILPILRKTLYVVAILLFGGSLEIEELLRHKSMETVESKSTTLVKWRHGNSTAGNREQLDSMP